MPTYEVIYFNLKGRAESIRIMFHTAKADWKDTRVEFKDWPAMKPTTPLGAMPVVKIDGDMHCQSSALLRYAGKLAGWYPEDPLQALVVDEAVDTMSELSPPRKNKDDDEEAFKKARVEFQETKLTLTAKFLEGLIQRNGGCFFVKDTPSIADLQLVVSVATIQKGIFDHVDPKFFDAYPGIMATFKATMEHPDVVSYNEKYNKEE